MHRLSALTLLVLCSHRGFSQPSPILQIPSIPDYPRGYFRDPLDIPITLAANFGELRPNHYHMGLDIRTQKRVNLPVHAAADGYIAHVRIEPEGFGQAIYINHPNGYTTLYAHLNRFSPALAAYIREQQYRLQSWQVDLDIPAGMFPVRKGDQIAWSGSTGGSQGPHLHFEIRRTSGNVNCNPLLFGLPVPDAVPPVIQRLALYDRDRSVYQQTPRILAVHRQSPPAAASSVLPATTAGSVANYEIDHPLVTVDYPRVSFAISAFDSQSGSTNPNGIFEAVIYDGDRAISGFRMDRISYEDTRRINAHIDYAVREKGGPWLEHLSRLPGYHPPSIYFPFHPDIADGKEDGVVDLHDQVVHSIRIEVKDANGNTAGLHYQIRYVPAADSGDAVMLADTAVFAGSASQHTPVRPKPVPAGKRFYPNMLDGLETDDCAFYIPERGVYDPVWIRFSRDGSAQTSTPGVRYASPLFTIGEPSIPLEDPLLVRILAEGMPDSAREHVVMVRSGKGGREVERPQWESGWASARFGQFGSFRLVEDRTPPVIQPVNFREGSVLTRASAISFRVRDDLGGLRHIRAELDPGAKGEGRWLCFTNDKYGPFIYTFDEHCPRGRHVLKITAEDAAGNKTTALYHFIR